MSSSRTKKAPKTAAKKTVVKKPAPRADYGAPIDGMIAKQPPELRAIIEELRALIADAAPDATAQLKWGMPNFSIGKSMMCAIGGHKSHVNLVLSGPPQIFTDPKGLLEGEAKTGRHLKLTSLADLPRAAVKGWLRAAAKHARGG
jgi:hypothetical protein